MNLVLLTNDNYFSFLVLEKFLSERKDDISLVVFSTALIGKRGTFESIQWSIDNTGLRHTIFKLMVYGIFRFMKIVCTLLPFIPNKYSSFLWVKRNGIDYIHAANINSVEVVEKIELCKPDLIVSVSMNQIVKEKILTMPPKRCINVHCAPLPKYAGMSPYVWALANNEDHSAATIHYMEQGLDEGDIIVQEKISVRERDSAFALFHRCCSSASGHLTKVVKDIEDGTVTFYEQDLTEKTYFSWPDKDCVKRLRDNGYRLARVGDFLKAIFGKR